MACNYCEHVDHLHGCPNHEGKTPVERGWNEFEEARKEYGRGEKEGRKGKTVEYRQKTSAFLLGWSNGMFTRIKEIQ